MDREQALTELLEREQIRELATRYSFAADSKDFDAVADLFDPEVDNGKFGKGREATKAYYARLLGGMPEGRVVHMISNHQIDFVDETHAWGMVYVRAFMGAGEPPTTWTDVIACYVDDYVKRGDRWYFARRRPTDLTFLTTEQDRKINKLALDDGWAIHRERQAQLRGRGFSEV